MCFYIKSTTNFSLRTDLNVDELEIQYNTILYLTTLHLGAKSTR